MGKQASPNRDCLATASDRAQPLVCHKAQVRNNLLFSQVYSLAICVGTSDDVLVFRAASAAASRGREHRRYGHKWWAASGVLGQKAGRRAASLACGRSFTTYGGRRTVLLNAIADGGQHGQRVAGKGRREVGSGRCKRRAAGNTRYQGTPVDVSACREDHRPRIGGQRAAGGEQRGRVLRDRACALGCERREAEGSQDGA
ncbi:hypothetical protein GGX14DRAFT_398737 [Mycena pura]|uniref:Uncharacterized protein n=1 Tax=Mycena pura TaxID=153505 RepID=A0AAD6V664_9AGAR|nr:hypothetical protein GGX14DRAFT_398737 [Mycena pura]